MNIEFKQITLQNFLSFGNAPTTIPLGGGETNLILGQNLDVGGTNSSRNGVGKTTMLQGIMWALYDEVFTEIKKDQLINIFNKKNMVVTLELSVDSVDYKITRGRKPSILEITRNGEAYTQHSNSTVNSAIEDLIGINVDTFKNTTLLSTATTPFMGLKPTAQKNYIEKLVGLDILSERAISLKTIKKELEIEIKLEEQRLSLATIQQDKAELSVKTLTEKQQAFDVDRDNDVGELTATIRNLNDVDFDKVIKLHDANQVIDTEIDKLSSEISDQTNAKIEAVSASDAEVMNETTLTRKEMDKAKSKVTDESTAATDDLRLGYEKSTEELTTARGELSELTQLLKDLNAELVTAHKEHDGYSAEYDSLSDGECPYCHQQHVDKDLILSLKESISRSDTHIATLTDDIKVVNDNIPDNNDKIDSISKIVEEQREELSNKRELTKNEIESITNKYQQQIDDITDTGRTKKNTITQKSCEVIKKLESRVSVLTDKKISPEFTRDECVRSSSELTQLGERLVELEEQTNPFTELLSNAEQELTGIVVDQDVLYGYRSKTDHINVLIKLLTDNKSFVRKMLLDQYIPFINNTINNYCSEIGLIHKVKLNNDLTVDIDYMGRGLSYGNLSNGEAGRLNFCTSLAFRELLAINGHNNNLFMIDELLDDGMDSSGFNDIYKLITKSLKGVSVFIVSHRDDLLTMVDNTITVTKRDGFTEIQ